MRIAVPATITAAPAVGCRAIRLTEPSKRGGALVLPIGLPCLAYPSDRGGFGVQDGELVLKQASEGRRCWLPLLVSWDPLRTAGACNGVS